MHCSNSKPKPTSRTELLDSGQGLLLDRGQTLGGFRRRVERWILGFHWLGWLLIAGCGVDPQIQRMVGTWELELEVNPGLVDQLLDGDPDREISFQERLMRGAAKRLLADKAPEIEEKLGGVAGKSMQLRFDANGTWSSQTLMSVAQGEKRGRWRILASEVDQLQLECVWTEPKSGESQASQIRVQFLGPDKLRMIPPNMAGTDLELTFIRQAAK